jgi:hypothetical protein
MSRSLFVALVLAAWIPALPNSSAHAASKVATAKCSAPVYRQFDFWLGDWDTFDSDAPGKPSIARNHVDAILDGCVLREDYDQFDGHHGQSFTIYDATRKVWHQSWVTNRGELLVLEGRLQGSRIVLDGIDHRAGNTRIRVSWEPQADGVREIAIRSLDEGNHWQPMFDIVFHPHLTGK